jgi:hypothetical protein
MPELLLSVAVEHVAILRAPGFCLPDGSLLSDLDDAGHASGDVPFDVAMKEPAPRIVGFPEQDQSAARLARPAKLRSF